MKRRSLILILIISQFLLTTSCEEATKEKTAQQILQNTIEAYGGEKFYTSQIDYTVDDLEYTLKRNRNRTDFKLVRKRDTITYIATYKNGFVQYYINGEEQADGTFAKRILNFRLEGFIYTSSIPFVLDQNYVKVTRSPDVIIRKKSYMVLHIAFTQVENEPDNEFYLYIDKETNRISFSAENYEYSGQINIFKRFHNFRKVKGILFSDCYAFKPAVDTIPLNRLYKHYDIATMQDHLNYEYKDIEVTLNNANNE